MQTEWFPAHLTHLTCSKLLSGELAPNMKVQQCCLSAKRGGEGGGGRRKVPCRKYDNRPQVQGQRNPHTLSSERLLVCVNRRKWKVDQLPTNCPKNTRKFLVSLSSPSHSLPKSSSIYTQRHTHTHKHDNSTVTCTSPPTTFNPHVTFELYLLPLKEITWPLRHTVAYRLEWK